MSARVDVLGVAWLRIATAGPVLALWRRPWRRWAGLDARRSFMLALLPAPATVVGVVVLTRLPTAKEVVGVALVVGGVAVHRPPPPTS